MKALFQGQEYFVTECYGSHVELEPVEGTEDQRITVDLGDKTLIVDPTDGELDAAKAWRERMPSRSSATHAGKEFLLVESSHGTLVVDRTDGVVIRELSTYDGDELKDIVRFDLEEYKRYWKEEVPKSLDILNLGYWIIGGAYEEPAHDWRKELVAQRMPSRGQTDKD